MLLQEILRQRQHIFHNYRKQLCDVKLISASSPYTFSTKSEIFVSALYKKWIISKFWMSHFHDSKYEANMYHNVFTLRAYPSYTPFETTWESLAIFLNITFSKLGLPFPLYLPIPGISLYKGKGMVPDVQLSTNYGLGWFWIMKNIFQ